MGWQVASLSVGSSRLVAPAGNSFYSTPAEYGATTAVVAATPFLALSVVIPVPRKQIGASGDTIN
jgi:hypothetical protein